MNFGEVLGAQLAKSTLLTSTLVPLDLLKSFKVCSDGKERVGCGKAREDTIPCIPGITADFVPEFAVDDLPLAELQPRFLRLQWRTCP